MLVNVKSVVGRVLMCLDLFMMSIEMAIVMKVDIWGSRWCMLDEWMRWRHRGV